jgi:RND family efflux transporter MFP subunit|nr:efflux RND transporter periplasmic adaptor subunit [Candidatus Krumholzibacteria bacterium]
MSRLTQIYAHGYLCAMCLLVGIMGLAGCQPAVESAVIQESPTNVRVLELAPDTLAEFFEITGPVTPVRGADISAQESGPVVAILAPKGQSVAAGAPILEQERKILRAEMASAVARLETLEFNLDKVQKLFAAGKVSEIELLNARSDFESARAMADISRERHARAMISAPFKGIVADRYVELGQMVMPGQAVARCIDPYTLKLEGYLTAEQVGWAQVDTPAAVRLGVTEIMAQGTVTWVGLEADIRTGKFKVEVEIPNPDLAFRSGVIGRAQLSKNIVNDVVTIPRDAVIKGRHGPEVFVVEGDRAHRLAVTLGPDQGRMVVVTSGLTAGQDLVIRGHRDLVEGGLVKVLERATSADGSLAADPGIVRSAQAGGQ